MRNRSRLAPLVVLVLVLVPIAVRLALAFAVDDFEDDAWARDLIAQRLAGDLAHGHFSLASLLGVSVWLPAWQSLCALVECVIPAPYYVPKVLAAIFGGLSPAVVFALARRLAHSHAIAPRDVERAGWFAWTLATLAPWSALYAGIGMSESFYAFWIVTALYALVRSDRDNHWFVLAASALAPAVWTRFEGWLLVPLFPLLALAQQRAQWRTLALGCMALAVPPVAWLAINRAVAGDMLHFQHVGAHDVQNFLAARGASWTDRSPFAIARHLGYIAAVNGLVVTALAHAAIARVRTRDMRAVAIALGSLFVFLFTLWLARRQVGWRRYYLPFGMPLFACAGVLLASVDRRRLRVLALLVALESLGVVVFQVHFVTTWVRPWIALRREAARVISARPGRVYCDEPTVRLLSGLPNERFVNQWTVVAVRRGEGDEALRTMRALDVRTMVFVGVDYSMLTSAFPWLTREGTPPAPFVPLFSPPRDRTGPRAVAVSVYALE